MFLFVPSTAKFFACIKAGQAKNARQGNRLSLWNLSSLITCQACLKEFGRWCGRVRASTGMWDPLTSHHLMCRFNFGHSFAYGTKSPCLSSLRPMNPEEEWSALLSQDAYAQRWTWFPPSCFAAMDCANHWRHKRVY